MGQAFDLSSARGRRALIISICRRRQRPGAGSDLRALMRRRPTVTWPDLRDLLGPIPWAVAGAVATRLYMPERATSDLDIVVSREDLPAVEGALAAAGWQRTGELAIGGSAWTPSAGPPLDVIGCGEPWRHDALREAAANRDAQDLPVLPLPYLIVLKMRASRTTDVGDVARMLGLADEATLARVRAVFERYAPEDLDDLNALTELGKLETQG